MLQLLAVIHALTLEVNSEGQMMATSRAKGDPYKIAKKNKWTFETGNGTLAARKRALRDSLAVMIANRPTYQISDLTKQALGDLLPSVEPLAQEIRDFATA